MKRGPGRPPKPASERATVEVKLRLTVAQWRMLRAWASLSDRPLAPKIAECALAQAEFDGLIFSEFRRPDDYRGPVERSGGLAHMRCEAITTERHRWWK